MFWKTFEQLCRSRGSSPTAVALELGFSNATATKWKKGSTPQGASLQKIAEYFNVSINYLLGKEAIPSIVAIAREAKDLSAAPTPNDTDIVIKVPLAALTHKLSKLDEIDLEKVEAYTDGLLAAEKYQEPTHLIKMAARAGGGIREVALTESQIEALKNLPEVPNLDNKK